ncbi:MAG: helix-turn-helix domain-containing protein [Chthoniobacteraceae bacterium]
MNRRHSEREVLWILTQIKQSGISIGAACEAHHITRMTYYRWQKRFWRDLARGDATHEKIGEGKRAAGPTRWEKRLHSAE